MHTADTAVLTAVTILDIWRLHDMQCYTGELSLTNIGGGGGIVHKSLHTEHQARSRSCVEYFSPL